MKYTFFFSPLNRTIRESTTKYVTNIYPSAASFLNSMGIKKFEVTNIPQNEEEWYTIKSIDTLGNAIGYDGEGKTLWLCGADLRKFFNGAPSELYIKKLNK
jgi:hypothetical protein